MEKYRTGWLATINKTQNQLDEPEWICCNTPL